MVNCLKYYHLEQYLFEDVHERFHAEQFIGAFDFFSIVIWKANRAKTRVAKRLWQHANRDENDLETIVRRLTTFLYRAQDPRERLQVLLQNWGFRLPMASAILTVL